MQSTLRSFIEPANIPKKYGGDLDFEFGMMPQLDPALKEVLDFKGGRADFPGGPLYWVDADDGDKAAISVGSVAMKERKDLVAVLKVKEEQKEVMNGNGVATETKAANPSTNPRVNEPTSSTNTTDTPPQINEPTASANTDSDLAVDASQVVPASRPEPQTFVTAREGIETLSLKENGGGGAPASAPASESVSVPTLPTGGPHTIALANALDPNVPHESGP